MKILLLITFILAGITWILKKLGIITTYEDDDIEY